MARQAAYNPGMAISIPDAVQEMIDERVRSGLYASADDVIIAAMTNLRQQEQFAGSDMESLERVYPHFKLKITKGMEDARAGRLSDGDDFFDELDRADDASGE